MCSLRNPCEFGPLLHDCKDAGGCCVLTPDELRAAAFWPDNLPDWLCTRVWRCAGAAGILAWGAKGSKDVKLPITVGPQQPAQVGPRGRL
jgi:hypothetical protein